MVLGIMAMRKERSIDPGKLQSLAEPIHMKLERKKFGSPSPIILPGKIVDGNQLPSGAGWLRAEVLDFDNFVLNFAGGGDFTAYATDSNGETLVWDFSFKTSQYPEKIPFTMADASAPSMMAAAIGTPMTSLPATPGPATGFPFSTLMGAQVATTPVQTPQGTMMMNAQQAQQYYAQQQQYQQPHQQTQFGFGAQNPFSWGRSPFDRGREREDDDRTKRLEEQLQELKLDREKATHQMQLDRDRSLHDAQVKALQDEMRKMQEAVHARENASPAHDELAKMREENARRDAEYKRELDKRDQELRAERDRSERERQDAKRDQQHQEQMRILQEQMATLAAGQQNRPDPVLEFMKVQTQMQMDAARLQADAQKEMARAQQSQADKYIDLIHRSKDGVDSVVNNVIGNFGRMFDTYRTMTESIMGMGSQNQTSPLYGLLENGMAQARRIADQYIKTKGDSGAGIARSNAQTAQAQAAAVQAQAQREAIALEAQRMAQAQAQPSNGAAHATGKKPKLKVVEKDKAPTAAADLPGTPSEQQLFGVPEVLEAIMNLRKHVQEGKVDPKTAVQALLIGVQQAEEKKLIVPAFLLFVDGQWSDLIEAMLPDATFASREIAMGFRNECVEILVDWDKKQVAAAKENDEDEEDEDGEEATN